MDDAAALAAALAAAFLCVVSACCCSLAVLARTRGSSGGGGKGPAGAWAIGGRRRISDGLYHTNFTLPNDGASGRHGAARVPFPIMPGADPGLFYEAGVYYLAATGVGGICTSRDLVSWTPPAAGSVQPSGTFWAPEIFKIGSTYWMCYADAFSACKFLRASSPAGPYTFSHQLAVAPTMDPSVLIDMDGRIYIFTSGIGYGVVIHELSADLRSVGASARVAQPDAQPWMTHGPVAEGPQCIVRVVNGSPTYVCVFSANLCCVTPDFYSLGYATAPAPMGPWTLAPDNPLVSYDAAWGYGHHCFGAGPNGNLFYMCQRENGNDRQLVMAAARFEGSRLVFDKPTGPIHVP